MGKIALISAILWCTVSFASDLNSKELRVRFYESVSSEKVARQYIRTLEQQKDGQNILVNGYKAAVYMVMAKHVFNPYSKIKYFIDGKNELEASISKHPKHPELILIRFAIQTNAPSFLGYTANISSDKAFLLQCLAENTHPMIDADLRTIMKQYLRDSKLCTQQELAYLQQN